MFSCGLLEAELCLKFLRRKVQSTAENRERNIDGTGNHALYDFLPFADIDDVCILIKRKMCVRNANDEMDKIYRQSYRGRILRHWQKFLISQNGCIPIPLDIVFFLQCGSLRKLFWSPLTFCGRL